VDRYFGNSGDYLNKRRKKYENGRFIADSSGGYFSNNHDGKRVAKVRNGEACWWWLRSPDIASRDAAYVFDDGYVYVSGYIVIGNGGVRPALWLEL
jgi:hypothetical protein